LITDMVFYLDCSHSRKAEGGDGAEFIIRQVQKVYMSSVCSWTNPWSKKKKIYQGS